MQKQTEIVQGFDASGVIVQGKEKVITRLIEICPTQANVTQTDESCCVIRVRVAGYLCIFLGTSNVPLLHVPR